jgi:hypothetical protein
MSALRNISAFAVAALVVGVAYAALNAADGSDDVVFFPALAGAALVAFLHAAVLGVPAVLVLRRLRKLQLPYVLFVAFVIGAFPIPIFLITTSGFDWSSGWYATIALACGALGALGGLTWWLVAGVSSNKSPERTRGR